jgi:hypothetical protein
MTAANSPDKVHLVGSIGLDTVDEVFRTVGSLLGRRLRRVPDGEPGGRRLWISFQYPALRASPFLRPDPSGAIRKTSGFPLLCLAEGVTADEVRFGELGYAREARASYLDFCAARERGDLPAGIRFQVCLPTPMGVIYAFCTARDLTAIEAAYEAAMIREVEAICRAIPHRDLCIQWDFCHDNASKAEIVARIARICEAVPPDVELGFHLCYGDFGGKHFFDPVDAANLVEVINAFTRAVAHPITYVHVPVPLSRKDDAYFRPFRDLKASPQTEIYLGLVHVADGVEGTRERIAVARKYLPEFGIATECGMARARKPDLVHRLLQIHAEVAREPG